MIWFYKIEYWHESEIKTDRGFIGANTTDIVDELENVYGGVTHNSIERIELRPVGVHIDENDIFEMFD